MNSSRVEMVGEMGSTSVLPTTGFQAKYDNALRKLIEKNAQTRPDYCRQLQEKRDQCKKHCESKEKLTEIQAHIVEKEALFAKERKKWVAKHRHLLSDMNRYFVERCQWETEFKETHLKPIYEERRIAAQGIKGFWGIVMFYYKLVSKQFTDKDGEAIVYLNDIQSCRTPDLKGFELRFHFDENPFFRNNILSKTYEVMGDNNDSLTLKAIGTKIDWNPSHNLAEKRGKRIKSFFNFFKSYATVDPLSFDIKADELKGDLPEDYEIGIKFRDEIIPHATSHFVYPRICC